MQFFGAFFCVFCLFFAEILRFYMPLIIFIYILRGCGARGGMLSCQLYWLINCAAVEDAVGCLARFVADARFVVAAFGGGAD